MRKNRDVFAESGTDSRMNTLLEKTRRVGRAVQAKHEGEPLNYSNLSKLLSEFSTANVYIVDKSGNLLGYNWLPEYTSKALSESFRDGVMPEEFVIRMNRCLCLMTSTRARNPISI